MTPKISFFLFAVFIGCVNESEQKPQVDPVVITDTVYLHGFRKLNTELQGTAIRDQGYPKGLDTTEGTLINREFYIKWDNFDFSFTSSGQWSENEPNGTASASGNFTLYQGSIRDSNKIEGSLQDTSYDWKRNKWGNVYQYYEHKNFISYNNIPLVKADSDSLVFILSGKTLESYITSFRVFNRVHESTSEWEKIIWNSTKPPSLKLTFYK